MIFADYELSQFRVRFALSSHPKGIDMPKDKQRGNREAKKPKKEKIKVIAAAPSRKAAEWQPTFGAGKKK
jgi:hypothetical protein